MKDAGKAAAPTHLFDLKKGQYSDGSPLDEVHYLESKIILKPDRFTSAKVFLEFGELIQGACRKCGVAFSRKGVVLKPEDELNLAVYNKTADELLKDPPDGDSTAESGLNAFPLALRRYTDKP